MKRRLGWWSHKFVQATEDPQSKPVDVEGEDGFFNEALVDHVVEDRGDSEDRDGWEGHAEDAVKLGSQEGETGLVGGLGKGLAFNANSGQLEKVVYNFPSRLLKDLQEAVLLWLFGLRRF